MGVSCIFILVLGEREDMTHCTLRKTQQNWKKLLYYHSQGPKVALAFLICHLPCDN